MVGISISSAQIHQEKPYFIYNHFRVWNHKVKYYIDYFIYEANYILAVKPSDKNTKVLS